MGTRIAIKDVLSVMGNQERICRCFWSPEVDDAITNTDARDFTWDTAYLELLNRLHSA
jgi:hypothetical protein